MTLTGVLFKDLTGCKYKEMCHQICGLTVSLVLFQLSRVHLGPQTILPCFYQVHCQTVTPRNFIYWVHIHPHFCHRRLFQLATLTSHPLPCCQGPLIHTLCLHSHLFPPQNVLFRRQPHLSDCLPTCHLVHWVEQVMKLLWLGPEVQIKKGAQRREKQMTPQQA